VAALVLFVLKSAKLCFWPKCPSDGAVQYLMEYQNMAAGMAAYLSTNSSNHCDHRHWLTTARCTISNAAATTILLPQLIDCWLNNKVSVLLFPLPVAVAATAG